MKEEMKKEIKVVYTDGTCDFYNYDDDYIKELDILTMLREGLGYIRVDDLDFYLYK